MTTCWLCGGSEQGEGLVNCTECGGVLQKYVHIVAFEYDGCWPVSLCGVQMSRWHEEIDVECEKCMRYLP